MLALIVSVLGLSVSIASECQCELASVTRGLSFLRPWAA